MIYDLFDIDMPSELVGVTRSTELVLRFNSVGQMWESEMLPVEYIMVREVEHALGRVQKMPLRIKGLKGGEALSTAIDKAALSTAIGRAYQRRQ